jgi:hypothetical protein
VPLVPLVPPAAAKKPFRSFTTLSKADCKSAGACPLLTCEIKTDKPAANWPLPPLTNGPVGLLGLVGAGGGVVAGVVLASGVLPVAGVLPEAGLVLGTSALTAWNKACMNWRMSDLRLLRVLLESSESSSRSVRTGRLLVWPLFAAGGVPLVPLVAVVPLVSVAAGLPPLAWGVPRPSA